MDQLSARRDNMQSTHEPTCPFCGQDLSPEHRATLVEEIEADGKKLGDEYRENQNRINDIDARLKTLDGELQTIARLETEKHALERKTDVTRAWLGDREPEVEKWETYRQDPFTHSGRNSSDLNLMRWMNGSSLDKDRK